MGYRAAIRNALAPSELLKARVRYWLAANMPKVIAVKLCPAHRYQERPLVDYGWWGPQLVHVESYQDICVHCRCTREYIYRKLPFDYHYRFVPVAGVNKFLGLVGYRLYKQV